MNALSKQHNKLVDAQQDKLTVEQETALALTKVQDLCREAYSAGFTAGYGKGFEVAAKALTGRIVEGHYSGLTKQ